jgi:hypothetical protein
MNTKTLFRLGLVLLVLTMVASLASFAQTTIYVNNNGGVDSRTGQLSDPNDNINGPVATISRAIQLAVSGSTISVAYTGVPYSEPAVTPANQATISIPVTMVSTGGNVSISASAGLFIDPGANQTVTFSGPFTVTSVLYLNSGAVSGGSNITVSSTGSMIRRNAGTDRKSVV